MNRVKDTSIKAYHEMLATGKLAQCQREVLEVLREFPGGLTNNELCRSLAKQINSVVPRVNELVKLGIVEPCIKRRCGITGRLCYAWRVVTMRKQLSLNLG